MPSRGYRKGLSDAQVPAPYRVHTRLPDAIHAALIADAEIRSMTASRILRTIIAAHYTGQRAELPQARGANAATVRELARIGNNLNQIAHQANLLRLSLLEPEARRCIEAINAVVARIAV